MRFMNNLGVLYKTQGRLDDAAPWFGRVLAAKRRALGDEHVETVDAIWKMASIYLYMRRLDEAEALFLESIEAHRARLGDRHQRVAADCYNLACCYALRGDPEAAFDYLDQAVDAGWTDADALAGDSDLASLRGDARFNAVVARARAAKDEK
jgi:tetratricopeptide (TPR) repeat protein